MLLDISGNTFSTLGNSVPTRLFGPRELFGDSLLVHVDTTDYRNLFTTATGSTNVSLTGRSHVKRIDDISGKGRKFYYFTGSTAVESTIITGSPFQETFTSTTLNQFTGSTFDTNKGVFGINTGTIAGGNFQNNIIMVSPFSSTRNIAPESAATFCSYLTYFGANNAVLAIGVGINYISDSRFSFISQSFGSLTFTIDFYVKNVPRLRFTLSGYANKTFMLLGTISGNSYSIYINNILLSTGTMTGSIYPLNGVVGAGGFTLDTMMHPGGPTQSLTKTHEGFISSSYTTPEQANQLYSYFITKFKNKVGNYR
jgi:hypothetical protein